MTGSTKLISLLRTELQRQADPKAAVKMQSYMKSSMPFYGVKAPQLRTICKSVISQLPLNSFDQWYATVLKLWRTAKYREERYCAIQLCEAKQYQPFQTLDTIPLYEEMIVTGAWWDYVDVIASHRIRYLLGAFSKQVKPLMKRWAKDADIWKRRTAIICQLNLKQDTDLELLYACIKPSLGSDEFFLQKAIGWALRSYAWHDINEVLRYVAENQHCLSPLSQREALKNKNKLVEA